MQESWTTELLAKEFFVIQRKYESTKTSSVFCKHIRKRSNQTMLGMAVQKSYLLFQAIGS